MTLIIPQRTTIQSLSDKPPTMWQSCGHYSVQAATYSHILLPPSLCTSFVTAKILSTSLNELLTSLDTLRRLVVIVYQLTLGSSKTKYYVADHVAKRGAEGITSVEAPMLYCLNEKRKCRQVRVFPNSSAPRLPPNSELAILGFIVVFDDPLRTVPIVPNYPVVGGWGSFLSAVVRLFCASKTFSKK